MKGDGAICFSLYIASRHKPEMCHHQDASTCQEEKSMPHSVPKAESCMILASIVHETRAGTLLRHTLSLLFLGSKGEVVQLCPEHGEDTCCSQYAHW